MKITGGSLRPKTLLSGTDRQGAAWEEKAEQLRLCSGARFRLLEEAEASAQKTVRLLLEPILPEGASLTIG